jgi:hypothetical protein
MNQNGADDLTIIICCSLFYTTMSKVLLYVLDNGMKKTVFLYTKAAASPVHSKSMHTMNGSAVGSSTRMTTRKGILYVIDRTQAKVHN